MKEGAEFEEAGNNSGAFQKYVAASEIFDSIAAQYPSWNPHMVNYRRRSIRTSITQSQSRARTQEGITGSSCALLTLSAPTNLLCWNAMAIDRLSMAAS